ncbi:DUF4097 family beta strand repeat-containing protein [Yinghuangia sp. YIM S09857]|uniref:DUF4097 family beta strand repeat-containing protein n=1 Tax=Yinghuangia sp. YIM S09857 TaxID=3436929 RepID=UPI003F53E227
MARPARIALFSISGALFAGLVGSAAFTGLVLLSSHDVSAATQFDLPGESLTVESDDGAVHLVPGEPGRVHVDRKTTESIRGADPEWSLTDGILRLGTNCPSFFSVDCDGDYTVTVPPSVKTVKVRSGDGSISVRSLTADLDLRSEDGSMTVRDVRAATLRLATSDGSVSVSGTAADAVVVSSGDGGVSLTLTEPPAGVKASTGDGSLRLTLPRTGDAYRTTVKVGDGSQSIQIKQDPDATRTLDLSTGDGSVRVRYAD